MYDNTTIKNVPLAEVQTLAGLVDYQAGQVVSRTLSQNPNVSLTLFAFEQGEGLSSHTAPGDALVHVLDGAAVVDIEGVKHRVSAGEMIVMPSGKAHGLEAPERFKMLLVLVKAA